MEAMDMDLQIVHQLMVSIVRLYHTACYTQTIPHLTHLKKQFIWIQQAQYMGRGLTHTQLTFLFKLVQMETFALLLKQTL